jgi:peptidoglycan/xylan/chitin deacetylase (PgdA/CDA1 family)
VLSDLGVRATFFMCGAHALRLPAIARHVRDAGHEIGNHTQNHPFLWMRSRAFLRTEITDAQRSISEVTGVPPRWFRAPYGVRWPGLARVQQDLGLTGVMWTVIGYDWTLTADRIASRVLKHAGPGGIICLHDGRELRPNPDISQTIEAVRIAIPKLLGQGYEFRTLTQIFR